MHRNSPLLLFAFVAFGGGCARARAPNPVRPNADGSDLRQLATTIDDESAAPIWPMVPADLKARAEARIPTSLTPDERRRLGEIWVNAPNVTERRDGRDSQEAFLSFLGGWAVLEDLAWSPNSDQHVAAAMALYARLREAPFTSEFRRDMTFFERTALAPMYGQEQKRKFDSAFSLGPVRDLIAGHKVALERHFAAEILRGPPSAMMARVLRDESARRSELREFQLALPFAAAAARLLPGASQVWLELAKVSYQVDDVAGGDDALKRALALGADRESQAVRQAMRFQTFAHEPLPKTFEQSLSRFWALFDMERLDEARTLVDQLRRQRPNDARAFSGDIWLRFLASYWAGAPYYDVVHASFLAFDGARDLTARDQGFDRAYLSLAFQEVMRSFMLAAAAKRPIGLEPAFVAAIERVRRLSEQLSPSIPGEAEIYALAAAVLQTGVPPGDGRPGSTKRAWAQLFPRALAVYGAHPGAESYRLLLGLAMVTDDWNAVSAAITAPLRFDPGDDEQTWLFRARAFVSAAARAKDWRRLRSFSTLFPDDPRWSDETKHDLDLLRADVNMLLAAHGDQTLWTSAASAYTHTSWREPFFDQTRAYNNAAAICDIIRPGADSASYWSDLRTVDEPDWPILVNGAAKAFRAGHQHEALAILKSRSPVAGDRPPDLVADWLACLEGVPAKQQALPPAEGENPAVEVVDGRSKQSDSTEPSFSWRFTPGLGVPSAKATLLFSMWEDPPWLVASPRLCWATRTTP